MAFDIESLLLKRLEQDTLYQNLLKDCLSLEPEYLRIRDALPLEDQQILEHYLSLCEEMDHRRLYIALTP